MTEPLPLPQDLIPHRGRFLLLDRILRLDATEIEALGRFTPEDVEGHFPGQPVVPGVLLLEGLAQAMLCLHLSQPATEPGTPYLTGFEKVRFRAPVLPPAEVVYKVTLTDLRMGIVQASGTVLCGGGRACTAKLSGVILPGQPAVPGEA